MGQLSLSTAASAVLDHDDLRGSHVAASVPAVGSEACVAFLINAERFLLPIRRAQEPGQVVQRRGEVVPHPSMCCPALTGVYKNMALGSDRVSSPPTDVA
jgi:hypothetical protein